MMHVCFTLGVCLVIIYEMLFVSMVRRCGIDTVLIFSMIALHHVQRHGQTPLFLI